MVKSSARLVAKLSRIRKIGREITALSDESKKLRIEVGEWEECYDGRTVVTAHPEDENLVLVWTIKKPKDPKCKDWNVTFESAKWEGPPADGGENGDDTTGD